MEVARQQYEGVSGLPVVVEQDFGAQPRVDVALEGLAPGLYPVGVYRGGAVTWHSIVVR